MQQNDHPLVLHLYIQVRKSEAFAVKKLIEQQFGSVEACYLTDSWYEDNEDNEERTIYYQRLLNPPRDGLEDWEESDDISNEKLAAGITALRKDPRSCVIGYRINDSQYYEY